MNFALRGSAVFDFEARHNDNELRCSARMKMETFLYADTNLRVLAYVPESSYGVIPASPTLQTMRTTGDTLAYNKTQVISREIRADRMVPSIIETGVTIEGALNMEVSLGGTWDNLFQAVLCGTWVNLTLSSLTLAFTAGTASPVVASTVARTSGSWVSDGVVPGVYLLFGGSGINAANPGPWKVTNVTALTLTVEDPNLSIVTQSGVTAGTAAGSYLINGTTKRSYVIEKDFSDIGGAFVQFLGMRPVEWAFNLKAQAIIDGTMTFWGDKGQIETTTCSTGGPYTAPTTTPSISASADVATLQYQNANIQSPIKDLAITVTNTPRHRPIVGSLFDADIGFGQFSIRMTGTALVENLNQFTDVISHNTVAIDVPCFDGQGNYLYISFPATKLTGNPDTPAGNQDVDFRLTAEAYRDPTTAAMIMLNRVTVPGTLG